MIKTKNRYKLLFVLLFSGVIFLLPDEKMNTALAGETYSCPAGMHCVLPGSYVQGIYRASNCAYIGYRWTYTCSGTDSACTESRALEYYKSLADCQNADPDDLCRTGCCSGGGGGEPEPCIDCSIGSCPAPLTETGAEEFKLYRYRSCEKGGSCDGEMKYGDCYEPPSAPPTSSLQVLPSGNPTSLGCTSSTHTGLEINNQITMQATYTDPDSPASDIEALYVWLKTVDTPHPPAYIDPNFPPGQPAKTFSNFSYGFMMHKEGGNWRPYTVSMIGGGNDKWVRANDGAWTFFIKGPSGVNMLAVEIVSIVPSGNTVTMNFRLDYRNIPEANRVSEGSYNIFVMANDVFGFTPYDNYGPEVTKIGDYWNPNQIRYYQSWTDSGKNWNIDFTRPEINSLSSEVTGPTKIKFNWNIGDLKALYALVGNVYVSEGVEEVDNITEVVLISIPSGGEIKTIAPLPYLPQEQGGSTIGDLSAGYLAKAVNLSGVSQIGNLEMNVNANRDGSLIYYLTAFDAACNYNQQYSSYNLEDWIITYGGLVYSSQGVDFAIKNIEDQTLWGPIPLLNKINPLLADVSSEMYGNALSNPTGLTKSGTTDSYTISPFTAYNITDYYNDVRNTFERREVGLDVTRLNPNISTLTGNLGGGTIKVLDRINNANLSVGDANPFICNGKGIFFVSGNLTINNEILNGNYNSDACIFVVKGNLIINPGPNSSGGGLGYDEINAYILVNGDVTVNADATYDGLYISGGIQTLQGLEIGRFLGLNYRNTHPLFVVNHHSKYGIFSSILIGNPIDMVKVEVGFKPF